MKARDMACLLLVGLSVLCMTLCISCSRVQGDVPFEEQEIPDMQLVNADYTLGGNSAGTGSSEPVVMHASLITIYGKGKDTVLENVSFRQKTKMSGSCARATVSSDYKKAVLSGDVFVDLNNDGTQVTIETQRVEWDGKENTLLCEGEVKVTYGDGTVIRAEGFSATMDEDRYEFSRILEGKIDE
jgi:LPS export ABC transporter protein LptC